MEYIFWGNNIPLATHLRETLQCKISECLTFQQLKSNLTLINEYGPCQILRQSVLFARQS